MIMQQFNDASTYKKLDLNIDMQIRKNLKKLLHKYNKCFTKYKQKFLNKKSFETSNVHGLPTIHQYSYKGSNAFSKRRGSRGSGTSRLEAQTNCCQAKLLNKKT